MDFDVALHAIGVVRTSRTELAATPIQSSLNHAEHGTIEIDGRYAEGLAGLAGFDYAWMLTWLHRPDDPGADPPLRQVPFLLRREQREMGMFAARGPRHINPIGLSLIRLLDVTGPAIRFAGVDVLDGTPVIDLKPYVARFDRPPGEPRCGWFDHVPISDGLTPADLLPRRRAPVRRRAQSSRAISAGDGVHHPGVVGHDVLGRQPGSGPAALTSPGHGRMEISRRRLEGAGDGLQHDQAAATADLRVKTAALEPERVPGAAELNAQGAFQPLHESVPARLARDRGRGRLGTQAVERDQGAADVFTGDPGHGGHRGDRGRDGCVVRDPHRGPAGLTAMDRDETLGLEHAQCLADDGQADSEFPGEDFLPGEPFVRQKGAIEDLAAEPLGDHVGEPGLPQPRRRDRVMHHPRRPGTRRSGWRPPRRGRRCSAHAAA